MDLKCRPTPRLLSRNTLSTRADRLLPVVVPSLTRRHRAVLDENGSLHFQSQDLLSHRYTKGLVYLLQK